MMDIVEKKWVVLLNNSVLRGDERYTLFAIENLQKNTLDQWLWCMISGFFPYSNLLTAVATELQKPSREPDFHARWFSLLCRMPKCRDSFWLYRLAGENVLKDIVPEESLYYLIAHTGRAIERAATKGLDLLMHSDVQTLALALSVHDIRLLMSTRAYHRMTTTFMCILLKIFLPDQFAHMPIPEYHPTDFLPVNPAIPIPCWAAEPTNFTNANRLEITEIQFANIRLFPVHDLFQERAVALYEHNNYESLGMMLTAKREKDTKRRKLDLQQTAMKLDSQNIRVYSCLGDTYFLPVRLCVRSRAEEAEVWFAYNPQKVDCPMRVLYTKITEEWGRRIQLSDRLKQHLGLPRTHDELVRITPTGWLIEADALMTYDPAETIQRSSTLEKDMTVVGNDPIHATSHDLDWVTDRAKVVQLFLLVAYRKCIGCKRTTLRNLLIPTGLRKGNWISTATKVFSVMDPIDLTETTLIFSENERRSEFPEALAQVWPTVKEELVRWVQVIYDFECSNKEIVIEFFVRQALSLLEGPWLFHHGAAQRIATEDL